MFQRNTYVTSSGSKKSSKDTRVNQVASTGLFFNPEDEGYMYLQNVN
jgi:hypothetical protein